MLDSEGDTQEYYDLSPFSSRCRSVKELERQYNALRERLDKERAISGDPVTIAERYLATKQRYKAVSEDLSKQINLMSVRTKTFCLLTN